MMHLHIADAEKIGIGTQGGENGMSQFLAARNPGESLRAG
jgi:hypothetical protein